jgi:hypothetical protein
MKWVDALKVYNTGKSWCVPRKGSPEHAEVMKIMGKSKVESPAAPVAAAKMSVSKAEAVKQIKAHKEKEEKVSSMAAKVKERKAERLLKALVVARRAKKAAAAEAAAAAAPKAGSLEYFLQQKEKFKGTKYEKGVDEEIRAMRDAEIDKLDVKNVEREFLHNFKDPVKVKKLVDELNQITRDSTKREQEITAMMTKIPAPKGTKAQIIELIREMVTNPVDRLKLRLDYRDKGTLQTIYMNTKARYDWYKKNKPGQGIDYYLD